MRIMHNIISFQKQYNDNLMSYLTMHKATRNYLPQQIVSFWFQSFLDGIGWNLHGLCRIACRIRKTLPRADSLSLKRVMLQTVELQQECVKKWVRTENQSRNYHRISQNSGVKSLPQTFEIMHWIIFALQLASIFLPDNVAVYCVRRPEIVYLSR